VASPARMVLDASALLALLNSEPGSRIVEESLSSAAVSAVNLSEVVSKLSERGMPAAAARTALEGLSLDVRPFDTDMAYSAGTLRPATRGLGLSLGDRACLALGLFLSATVLTTDRSWKNLKIGAKIRMIR
jgi:ribonuclease VapC